MNELVEKLKKNRVPWDLLTSAERICFKKVGKENCEFYDFCSRSYKATIPVDIWGLETIFRIKANYQPEPPKPEYYSCPVYADGGRLYIQWQGQKLSLHKVVSLREFADFQTESGSFYSIEGVATALRSNITIVARFWNDTSCD